MASAQNAGLVVRPGDQPAGRSGVVTESDPSPERILGGRSR